MDTSPLAPLAVTICVYLRMLKSSPLKILGVAAGDPDDRMRPLSLTGAISFYRPGPGPAPFSLKGGSGEGIKSCGDWALAFTLLIFSQLKLGVWSGVLKILRPFKIRRIFQREIVIFFL